MNKPNPRVFCLILGSSLLFHSCAGSFGTWNQLKNWNDEVEDKFINRFIFYAARVIPVYEICYLSDVLVLNPIEYWSGTNPIAEAESIQMIRCNDEVYSIITTGKGYTITTQSDANKTIYVMYFAKENKWKAIISGREHDIVKKNYNGTITIQVNNKAEITINPNEDGKNSIILAEGQKLIK